MYKDSRRPLLRPRESNIKGHFDWSFFVAVGSALEMRIPGGVVPRPDPCARLVNRSLDTCHALGR